MKKVHARFWGTLGGLLACCTVLAAATEPQPNTAVPSAAENPAPAAAVKPRIAVFPFTCIEIQGQSLYRFTDRVASPEPMETINDADRAVMDEIMLGVVREYDAANELRERENTRQRLNQENDRNWMRQQQLAEKILNSPKRSIVIGADRMAAELGRYDSMEVVESDAVRQAFAKMAELQGGGTGTPQLPNMGNATHVLYATVADLRTRSALFTGYGAKTESTIYSLDLLVRVVQISDGKIIFSGVFTGEDRELRTEYLKTVDSDRFTGLLQKAVEQAASALDRQLDAIAQTAGK